MAFFNGDIKTKELIIHPQNGATSGRLTLFDNDNSANLDIRTPSTITASYSITLPDGVGTNNYILQTDASGALTWVPKASGTIAADDITTGPTNVEITTTSGNIVSHAPSGQSVIFQNNSTTVATVSSTGVLQPTTSRLVFGTANTAIYSSVDGRMDVAVDSSLRVPSGSNVYFEASTGLEMSGTTFVGTTFMETNALQFRDSNNYIYASNDTNLHIVTVNTMNFKGNESIAIRCNSGNAVVFDVGGGDSVDQIRMSEVSSTESFVNMTSTAQDSGIGFKHVNSQLQYKPHTSQSFRPVLGFPKSITTVSANTVVSIPSGTQAINIKAVAAGGGGGGCNNGALGTGGGGGGGQFADIFIDSSNIASNTSVYIEIGGGGAGKTASSNANGDPGGDTVIKLVSGGSNSGALVTLTGGEGGYSDGFSSIGGAGGNTAVTLVNCIGYAIPGRNGDCGYSPGDTISRLTQGRGGDSHLGSGGSMGVYGVSGSSTNGSRGGGGAGAFDENGFEFNATNGGDGFAILTFY